MAHYKQKNGYGCGLYAIANALQDATIISAGRIGLSEFGNNLGQLNRWLWELEYDLWISMLVYNNEKPVKMFDLKPRFEEDNRVLWFPFFLVVKSTKEKNHMIGCRYMRDNSIIVHDSLCESEVRYENFEEFYNRYRGRVLSYECFYTLDNKPASIVNLQI